MKIPIIFLILLFTSACAADGSFKNPLSGIQVESPEGEKIGCVKDLEACTETCDVKTKDGWKIKATENLSPEICQVEEKEPPLK